MTRARLVEYETTVTAMVFTVSKCEGGAAAHARIRVDPCRRSSRCQEMRRDRSGWWWESDSYTNVSAENARQPEDLPEALSSL